MAMKSIAPTAVYGLIQAGEPVTLIDVRSPAEFNAGHAAGARSIPLDTLSKDQVTATQCQPVYVICRSGSRSQAACARLIEQGVEHVINVEGGTNAWQQAGLPVEALARRTDSPNWLRLGGLLAMVVGIVLGITVNPLFMLLAGGTWLAMTLTGNSPCCCSSGCITPREKAK